MVSQDVLPKPANRPSRRQDLIAAAIDLFSLQPSDLVTVADIVERAGMTPAAFYYHFSSREQLLEEVVAEFAETWVSTIERLLSDAQTAEGLSDVGVDLLDEIEPMEQVAKIFFLSGAAALAVVEQLRREARTRLVRSAARAVTRIDPGRTRPQALVNGITMVTLYESTVRSRLTLDESYRTLGPRRFREELSGLGRVASGFAGPA
jgi:AcrR family transcriptional regulator